MTEAVDEVQVGTGSNRVRVALISAAVPVAIAAISLVPRLIDSTGPPGDPSGMAIAEPSATQAAVSTPKLWKIKVDLEPEEPAEAVRLVRVIQDLPPDSDGQVVFTDVPRGVYRLYVVLKDREIDVTVDTDESHKDVRPPLRGVKSIEQ